MYIGFALQNGFPPPSGCICPGHILTFECTNVGGGITVWKGSFFNCPPANEIQITHDLSQFRGTNSFAGECNDGAVVASRLSVMDNNIFKSQLQVNRTASASLNGSTITCVHDGGVRDDGVSNRTWTIIGIYIYKFVLLSIRELY